MENQLIANICDAVTITALVVALAYSAFKRHREKKPTPSEGGFSLLELMIVVAIIGILSTLAIPRYRAFTAESRRSEARVNLKSIHTYQEAYMIANNVYWTPDGSGSLSPTGIYGFNGTDEHCTAPGNSGLAAADGTKKKLGWKFKSQDECEEMRYGYTINGNEGDYVARAHGGHKKKKWIYEQCAGVLAGTAVDGSNCAASDNLTARAINAAGLTAVADGDALCIGSEKPIQVIQDIVEKCK